MARFLPQTPAAFEQPDVQIVKGIEAFLARILPKPQQSIPDILLNDTFLPAARDIAECPGQTGKVL